MIKKISIIIEIPDPENCDLFHVLNESTRILTKNYSIVATLESKRNHYAIFNKNKTTSIAYLIANIIAKTLRCYNDVLSPLYSIVIKPQNFQTLLLELNFPSRR
jgi:hypothetical protein